MIKSRDKSFNSPTYSLTDKAEFMHNRLLLIAQRIQALAHTGLHYGTGPFDLERYEELRVLSLEIQALILDEKVEKLGSVLIPEFGYQTPKVDIRALVLTNGELLLVQERSDGKWSLPGGWADVGYSESEVVVKEVREETGLKVAPRRLLAIFDKRLHPHPPFLEYTYKVCIHCEVLSGKLQGSLETLDARYFSPRELPELSTDRILLSQIETLLKLVSDPLLPVYF